MRILKSMWLGVIILLMSSGICNGQPSQAVRYLMNTPASLWDFGIYRLEEKLERAFEEVFQGDPKVTMPSIKYQWDKNKISISSGNIRVHENEEAAKKKCIALLSTIKSELGFNQRTGKLVFPNMESSFLSSYFSHEQCADKSEAADFDRELDSITEIRATCSYREGNKQIIFVGKTTLFEADIFYAVTAEYGLK